MKCTAVFIDIRESSKLPNKHKRPVLGKIYRSYLSECAAVMNSDPNCREIVINGDCVSGVMNTLSKQDINTAFETTAKLNSLINILNWRMEQKRYMPIRCGIGISYGRALMMKAGYKGSALNDVIWMGDVVNEASNLCHQGNKDQRKAIQVSSVVYNNLNDYNKGLLSSVCLNNLYTIDHYEGDVINKAMDNWLKEEKEKSTRTQANAGLYGIATRLGTKNPGRFI